jgi:hypothetical protein
MLALSPCSPFSSRENRACYHCSQKGEPNWEACLAVSAWAAATSGLTSYSGGRGEGGGSAAGSSGAASGGPGWPHCSQKGVPDSEACSKVSAWCSATSGLTSYSGCPGEGGGSAAGSSGAASGGPGWPHCSQKGAADCEACFMVSAWASATSGLTSYSGCPGGRGTTAASSRAASGAPQSSQIAAPDSAASSKASAWASATSWLTAGSGSRGGVGSTAASAGGGGGATSRADSASSPLNGLMGRILLNNGAPAAMLGPDARGPSTKPSIALWPSLPFLKGPSALGRRERSRTARASPLPQKYRGGPCFAASNLAKNALSSGPFPITPLFPEGITRGDVHMSPPLIPRHIT